MFVLKNVFALGRNKKIHKKYTKIINSSYLWSVGFRVLFWDIFLYFLK